jgi:hypothetical protein
MRVKAVVAIEVKDIDLLSVHRSAVSNNIAPGHTGDTA